MPTFMTQINPRDNGFVIDIVQRNTKFDGMGPFKHCRSTNSGRHGNQKFLKVRSQVTNIILGPKN